MKPENIGRIRLDRQQIAGTAYTAAKDVVAWMGAMQAQDYNMAKWAIGVRLRNSTDNLVQAALDKGEIIRTHVLRPTWHLVSADDIYWMLALTAPRIKASMVSRNRQLALTEAVFAKSNAVIEKALSGERHLTREELVAGLHHAGIHTNDNRASHLLAYAELEGIICSGVSKGSKQTYALLEERVKRPQDITREEALAMLASRYFLSHGPATLQDFTWWSGLSVSDARRGLEMVRPDIASYTSGEATYWTAGPYSGAGSEKITAVLLPAFDEFIISYKDRSASLLPGHHKKAVSTNGLFRPVIVVNGKVVGLWKRVVKSNKVIIEAELFQPQPPTVMRHIERSAGAYGSFLNKQAELNFRV